MQITPFFWGWCDGEGPDYLLVLGQKIPDYLIKAMFLGEVEIAVRPGIKSRFGVMGFQHQ